jgi:predicted kinase
MKKKFIVCKGLSFSGKSTFAEEKARELGNTVIITKDDIRKAMGADYAKGIKVKESKVIEKRNAYIMEALSKGMNIISADTNLSKRANHIENMKSLVFPKYREQYDFEVKDFTDIPVKVLLERAEKTTRPEGKDFWKRVIMQQKNEHLVPKKLYEDPNYYCSDLPKCILVDADGTAAIHHKRSPFQFEKCGEDLPNQPMIDIAKMFCQREDIEVIILSGRPDTVRELTHNWFLSHGVTFDKLFMRKAGDHRSDTIVKREIYEAEIKDRYLVYAVFDDRKKVVEQVWVELGLPVFAFGNPYHDF